MSATTACIRCGSIAPQEVASAAILWTPTPHVTGKVQALARQCGARVRPSSCGAYLRITAGDLSAFLEAAAGGLTRMELGESRWLALDEPEGEPTLSDFGRVIPLAVAVARARNGWLADLLRAERVATLFQPIVKASDPGRVIGHECLLRGVDPSGALISAGRLLEAAQGGDLLFPLDRLARETHVRSVADRGAAGLVFINFTPTSVYDPKACLRTTIAAVDRAGLARDRIVFEVTEAERIDDPDHLGAVLDHYRREGFRVALDDVGAGYSSLNLLAELRPDFLKLDMHLVQGVAGDRVRATIVSNLIRIGRELGITVIAEGVEDAVDGDWLADAGADYLQGYLFGRPQASPLPV